MTHQDSIRMELRSDMEKEVETAYRKFIRRLVAYYGAQARIPHKDSVDIWVEEMAKAHIAPEKLDEIFDVVKQSPTFPSNLPQAVTKAAAQFIASQSVYQQVERQCAIAGCHGGLLFVRRECELGYAARYVFRCLACGRAHESGIPAAHLADLMRDGYRKETNIYAV